MVDLCTVHPPERCAMVELVAPADAWADGLEPALAARATGRPVLRLSPERRLVLLAAADEARHFADLGATSIDMGDAWRRIRIAGPAARDFLARGVALDLDPAAFPPGRHLQTLCARTPALLFAVSGEEIALHVATSYADWLSAWLHASLSNWMGRETHVGH